jgi:diguanylate cyclase (GGDEF)-like protein
VSSQVDSPLPRLGPPPADTAYPHSHEAWISLVRVSLLLSLVPALWFGIIPIAHPTVNGIILLLGGYVILLAVGPGRLVILRRADLIVVLDLLIITLVVVVSGSLSSPFLYFYYLTILEAAARLNLRQALAASMATAGTIVLLWVWRGQAEALTTPEFRLGAFIAGGFFVALSAGILIQEFRVVRERMQWARLLDQRLRDATAQLHEQLGELQFYNDLASRLAGELRVDGVLTILLHVFLETTTLPKGVAYVYDKNGDRHVVAAHGYVPGAADQSLERLSLPALADGTTNSEVIVTPHPADGAEPHRPTACIPLIRAGHLRAWLCGMGEPQRTITGSMARRLRGMAAQGVSALEAALLHEQVRQLAATDSLTGLANRRCFFERLGHELARSRRRGSPLSIVLLDLNEFKAVNDACGHGIGDDVLIRVAKILASHVRAYDLVARFGGDEFTLLLPETMSKEAEDIIGRLQMARLQVPEVPARAGGREALSLSFSWGIATWPEDGSDSEQLLQMADHRLYAMKQQLHHGAMSQRS